MIHFDSAGMTSMPLRIGRDNRVPPNGHDERAAPICVGFPTNLTRSQKNRHPGRLSILATRFRLASPWIPKLTRGIT
jgi:hypothetical protein